MTTLFNSPDTTIDPAKDYLPELVGDGKPYKTQSDLARAVLEKEAFINRLKGETEGLRTELNTRLTLEQYVEKMTPRQTQSQEDSQASPGHNPDDKGGSSLSAEDIEELVSKAVNRREEVSIQNRNLQTVQDELLRNFGNDYVQKLASTAAELGLSKETMDQMAKTQPKALLRLMGVGPERKPAPSPGLFTPPTSRETSFAPSVKKQNFAFYESLRKSDPKTYWLPATQNQMFKDALEQEEDFYNP